MSVARIGNNGKNRTELDAVILPNWWKMMLRLQTPSVYTSIRQVAVAAFSAAICLYVSSPGGATIRLASISRSHDVIASLRSEVRIKGVACTLASPTYFRCMVPYKFYQYYSFDGVFNPVVKMSQGPGRGPGLTLANCSWMGPPQPYLGPWLLNIAPRLLNESICC